MSNVHFKPQIEEYSVKLEWIWICLICTGSVVMNVKVIDSDDEMHAGIVRLRETLRSLASERKICQVISLEAGGTPFDKSMLHFVAAGSSGSVLNQQQSLACHICMHLPGLEFLLSPEP